MGWVFMPTHVRHHWVSSIITRAPNGHTRVSVFDSAPSPPTRRDIIKGFTNLGFDDVSIISHCRQPRGSNECGLHVVLLALRQAESMRTGSAPDYPTPSNVTISLHPWRAKLAHHLTHDTRPTAEEMFAAVPGSTTLISTAAVAPSTLPARATNIPLAPPSKPSISIWRHNPYGGGKSVIDPLAKYLEPARTTRASPPCGGGKKAHDKVPSQHHQANPNTKRTLPGTSAVPMIPQPLLTLPPPRPAGPSDKVFVVEDEYELRLGRTPIHWSDLQRTLIEEKRPEEVGTILRELLSSIAAHNTVEFEASWSHTKAQFDRLSPAEKKRRKQEFEGRLQRVSYSADNSYIIPERVPGHIKGNAMVWEVIRTTAERVEASTSKDTQATHIRDTFAGVAVPGAFISSRIIRQALEDASKLYPDWTLIDSEAFATFASVGTDTFPPAFQRNVAAILFSQDHYVLATLLHASQTLELRDSMNHPPSAGLTSLLGRLRNLLAQRRLPTDDHVKVVPVPYQALNDCAIDSINNLSMVITGRRGNLSRELLHQLAQHADPFSATATCAFHMAPRRAKPQVKRGFTPPPHSNPRH